MKAEHDKDWARDCCRNCGVRTTDLIDGHASRFCTEITGFNWTWQLFVPVTIFLVMVTGALLS